MLWRKRSGWKGRVNTAGGVVILRWSIVHPTKRRCPAFPRCPTRPERNGRRYPSRRRGVDQRPALLPGAGPGDDELRTGRAALPEVRKLPAPFSVGLLDGGTGRGLAKSSGAVACDHVVHNFYS